MMRTQSPIFRSKATYASARSKLSETTVVTPRSMSKLSVASVNIRCAASLAASAVVGTPPVPDPNPFPLVCLECARDCPGDVAREGGRERGDGPASPGP